jgi:hypothetical protein
MLLALTDKVKEERAHQGDVLACGISPVQTGRRRAQGVEWNELRKLTGLRAPEWGRYDCGG